MIQPDPRNDSRPALGKSDFFLLSLYEVPRHYSYANAVWRGFLREFRKCYLHLLRECEKSRQALTYTASHKWRRLRDPSW